VIGKLSNLLNSSNLSEEFNFHILKLFKFHSIFTSQGTFTKRSTHNLCTTATCQPFGTQGEKNIAA
jgi:hypothetical protein